jgi:hypothetical protein
MLAILEAKMHQEHNEKYDALIEQMGGIETVAKLIPTNIATIKAALKKGDKHLNTIPLAHWDSAANKGFPSGLSLAGRVCILKRAAVRLATS